MKKIIGVLFFCLVVIITFSTCTEDFLYMHLNSIPISEDEFNTYISKYTKQTLDNSIALDSKDNPHIVWCDRIKNNENYSRKYRVNYIKWDSDLSKWLCANGDIYDPISDNANISGFRDGSSKPKIILDENDIPHIMWNDDRRYSSVGYFIYIKWDTKKTYWVRETGEKYIPIDTTETISSGTPFGFCFLLDSKGNPHILWETHGSYEDRYCQIVQYAKWDDTKKLWVDAHGDEYNKKKSNVEIFGKGYDFQSTLALDSKDNAHIAWVNPNHDGITKIHHTKWDAKLDCWVNIDGTKYDHQKDADNITKNGFDRFVTDLSIDLDSKDIPHILWNNYDWGEDNSKLQYIKWDNQTKKWICSNNEEFDPISNPGQITGEMHLRKYRIYSKLLLDKNDNPNIIFHDEFWDKEIRKDFGKIYFIKWNPNGKSWIRVDGDPFNPDSNNALISGDRNVYYPNFALDSKNNPHVVWSRFFEIDFHDNNGVISNITSGVKKIGSLKNNIRIKQI